MEKLEVRSPLPCACGKFDCTVGLHRPSGEGRYSFRIPPGQSSENQYIRLSIVQGVPQGGAASSAPVRLYRLRQLLYLVLPESSNASKCRLQYRFSAVIRR